MNRTEYNIADNLPESLNRENVQQIAQVIDDKLHELDKMAELVSLYPRIGELSSNLIDELAIQLHVDFYDTTLDLNRRRELVKNSILWHMKKGTPYAVQSIVTAILDGAVVQENWKYDGKPYHFRVESISGPMPSVKTIDTLVNAIDSVKNVRSWLDGVEFTRNINQNIYLGLIMHVHKDVNIGLPKFKAPQCTVPLFFTSVNHIHKEVTINV